jgi:chemotaxis protein CheX
MARVDATPGKPFLKGKSPFAKGDVSGIIGLAGEKTKGSLAISFSKSTILVIASNMLGEEFKTIDDAVSDTVGEITNMLSGGARKILSESGYKFQMAIPSVIVGKDHIISHKVKGPVVVIPFETPSGKFFIEVCFEM